MDEKELIEWLKANEKTAIKEEPKPRSLYYVESLGSLDAYVKWQDKLWSLPQPEYREFHPGGMPCREIALSILVFFLLIALAFMAD